MHRVVVRVSTEFRRHAIPSVFFSSFYSVFRAELAKIPPEFPWIPCHKIPWNSAEFHGIPWLFSCTEFRISPKRHKKQETWRTNSSSRTLLHRNSSRTLCSISNGTGYLLPTVFFVIFWFRRYIPTVHNVLPLLDRYLFLSFLEFGIWNLDHLVTCGIPHANTNRIPGKFYCKNTAEFRGIPYVFQKFLIPPEVKKALPWTHVM